MFRFLIALAGCLHAWAAVKSIHVVERSDVLDGKPLGAAGAYERISAKLTFELDPALPANKAVRGLDRVPRNENGRVEFTADLYVLRPRDPGRGNGTLLVEVPNRGGKGLLGRFQYARGSRDPRTAEDFGDNFLLEQGFTLAWLGWQWDVPRDPQLLRAEFPVLQGVKGPVRSEFIPWEPATRMPLGDRNHIPYPVAPGATISLTVRDTVTGRRTAVPASAFRLAPGGGEIEMGAGFTPGRIYEAVYTSIDPPVVGLGLAGFRDLVSFLRHEVSGVQLLGDQRRFLKRSLAFGVSQSGRFLRAFLYYGFNTDEKGRPAFDGVWAEVAGAGRGSFNHLFAQASRDGHPFLNTLYPTDIPPFSDYGPNPPKIFMTNGSYEYWGRAAAQIHVSEDGRSDLPQPANVRIYFTAGAQHGPNAAPRSTRGARFVSNPNDFRPMSRALLEALHAWVKDGVEPPASVYPALAAGTLTPLKGLKFPAMPGFAPPTRPQLARDLDFGPEFKEKGVVSREPPAVLKEYPALVPQVDNDGNELGGIRMPVVAEPLGVFTGWNLRTESPEIYEMVGAFRRFQTPRYASEEEYLRKIDEAVTRLVGQRLLLERDRGRVREHARSLWASVAEGLKPRQ